MRCVAFNSKEFQSCVSCCCQDVKTKHQNNVECSSRTWMYWVIKGSQESAEVCQAFSGVFKRAWLCGCGLCLSSASASYMMHWGETWLLNNLACFLDRDPCMFWLSALRDGVFGWMWAENTSVYECETLHQSAGILFPSTVLKNEVNKLQTWTMKGFSSAMTGNYLHHICELNTFHVPQRPGGAEALHRQPVYQHTLLLASITSGLPQISDLP